MGTGCVLCELRVETEAIVDDLNITETDRGLCEVRAEKNQGTFDHLNIKVVPDRR
jgi:hypothetical protein